MRRAPLLAVLFSLATAMAQDRSAATAFDQFYNLNFNGALSAFRAEATQNPNSADAFNHVAQTILYREMFRSGALESQIVSGTNPFLRRAKMEPSTADEKEFHDAITHALDLSNAHLAQRPNDTAALYAQGVSYSLRATYNFLVRKAWLDSLRDFSAGRKSHNRATVLDPSFIDAQLVQGLYDYGVGSLPFQWKLLGFLGGFHGDRDRGIATLKLVADKGAINRTDAAILLCAIYRRESKPQDAAALLVPLIERYPRNFLLRFELVQMYSDLGEKEKALAAIREIELLKRRNAPGFDQLPEEKILYARGTLLFWYNDLDEALRNMEPVTAKARDLDLNTGVYAWLRLGQIHDLRKERPQALAAYQEASRYAPDSDAAREAQRYLRSPYARQP